MSGRTTPPTTRRWLGLAVIAAAQFMVIMDTSIIGVALPEMQVDLGFSQENLSWVFNAYVVTLGGLLLLGGRLSDLFGARRVFSTGWALLILGSVVAGMADTVSVELVGRAVQGGGAALIAPSALTLLMMLFGSDPRELTKALALYGAAAPAGGTAGVFLGGVITEYVSWPWVFYINVPIAVAVLAAVPAVMPAGGAGRRGGVDVFGALTVTGGLAAAVFAIVQAPEVGWDAGQTWLVLAVAAVLLVVFVAIQNARREPLMRLGIFKTPNLAAANLTQLLLGAAWIPIVVLPQPVSAASPWLQRLPQRSRPLADDRPYHDRHDRAGAYGHRTVRAKGDDRDRAPRAGGRNGLAVVGPAGRLLLGRCAAGIPGRCAGHVARLHPIVGHGDLQRPPGGGRPGRGDRQHQLPGRVSTRPGGDDSTGSGPRCRPARRADRPDRGVLSSIPRCRRHRGRRRRCCCGSPAQATHATVRDSRRREGCARLGQAAEPGLIDLS